MQPGITTTGATMRSPVTPHTATATADGWQVSWLPGRTLTRNQATTAMVIAHIAGGAGVGLADDPIWLHLDNWAAELGLSGPDAVARASEPPPPRQPQTGPKPEPFGGARPCAHADRDGQGAHWLAPGDTCQAEPGHQPQAGA